jgi:mannose-1-phosphate guanylyltransferase
MQIIISCGGGGTRLWPVSTESNPKQLVPLLDDESLMLKTYNRLRRKFQPDQIWVTVNEKHLQIVKNILPEEFHSNHIIAEPIKRDTFAAISLTTAIIASQTSADEPLIFVPSDDWIEKTEDADKLNSALSKMGESLAHKDYDVLTIGIKPGFPSTQLGYLETDLHSDIMEVIPVKSFKEKPDQKTADQYFKNNNFYWHKHNPSLTYNSLKNNISTFWPELLDILESVYLKKECQISDFEAFPKLSIDYAILEKSQRIGMVPLDINWDDVGTWEVVFNYLPKLDGENSIELKGDGNKVKLENPNLKVAFVGVSNLLVVQTKDGLLILDPKHSGEVKNVAEHFNKK